MRPRPGLAVLPALAVVASVALLAGPAAGAPPAAPAAAAPAPLPAVVLLPLLADATVSGKQARGVSAQLRSALEAGGFARPLSQSRDDEKQAERCRREAKCLADLADLRGADLVAAGLLSPAPDGLRIALVVVAPGATEATRRAETILQGNDGDARRIDRLLRSAFNPLALRGAIHVVGDAGAAVELDGSPLGTLPLAGPVGDLLEGEHVVVVKMAGYEDLRRTVAVLHDETVEVKAVLLGERSPDDVAAEQRAAPLPVDAIVASSIGAGLILLGGVAGTLALLDSLDVEARAKAQQLAFPQDSDLLLRGQVYAWTANGLYLVGAGALAAGAVLWMTHDHDGADDAGGTP